MEGPGAHLQGPWHTVMPRRGYRGHRGLIRRLAAPKLRICAVMKTKGRLGWCGGRAGAEGGLVRTAGRCDRLGEVSGQARRGRSAGRGRDWGAAGPRYTRLMTSKADHQRPLPHRHSPLNPLSFIFKSPFCPSCPFRPPPPPLGSLRPSSSSFLSAVGAAVLPGSEETIHTKLFHPPDLSNFALFGHSLRLCP